MTLLGLPLAQLVMLAAVAAVAVGLLYLLRLRPRRVTVPFLALWHDVLTARQSRSLWRRLRRVVSRLIQLLLILLVVAALGDPQLDDQLLSGRHIVLLLDASASMQSQDGARGSRMDTALAAARETVRALRGRDRMMIVRVDHRVAPLTPFTADIKGLLAALTDVRAADTPDDMAAALHFAADALRERQDPQLVVVGDGTYDAELFRSLFESLELRFVTVGSSTDNVGIVAFSARRDPLDRGSLALYLELVNYRDRPVSFELQLLADGVLTDARRLELAPRQHARYACDTRGAASAERLTARAPAAADATSSVASIDQGPLGTGDWCGLRVAGQLLEARLVGRLPNDSAEPSAAAPRPRLDAFELDNRAYAIVPPRRELRLLLVTKGNLFLEAALLPLDNVDLRRISPDALSAETVARYDVVVLDGVALPPNLEAHVIAIAPPAPNARPGRSGAFADPLITDQNSEHPVMRHITLKDVNMLQSRRLTLAEGDVVLASSFRRPLMLARQRRRYREVIIGFDVRQSDLPLRIAFPLLLANAIDWFADEQDDAGLALLRVGRPWRIPLAAAGLPAEDGSAALVTPTGERRVVLVHGGRAVVHGRQVGVYQLQRAGRRLRLAANLADARESDIAARRDDLLTTNQWSSANPPQGFLRRGLWVYLVLAAVALLAIEWLTYNRRVTV